MTALPEGGPLWPDQTAAVIGAGFAGMLAAEVLSRFFGTVCLVDRAARPEQPELRKTIPQAAHVHALLQSGQEVLEQLFPGFENSAIGAGSLPLKVRSGWRSFSAGRWLPPVETGVQVLSQTRPGLDHLIWQRLRSNPRIRPIEARVTGLLTDASGAVSGLHLSREDAAQTCPAALVVDASGRAEQAAQWLAALGYEAPPSEIGYPEVRYVSALFSRHLEAGEDLAGWLNFATAPLTTGAVLAPVEGQRWMVTATSRFEAPAPQTPTEFRSFLEALPSDKISQLLRDEVPVSALKSYRIASVRFNRFDQAARALPAGYLPVGDRIATFNPLYGQGMSVAALQCRALGETLAECAAGGESWQNGFAAAYLDRAITPARTAWLIGQASDMDYPAYRGVPSPEARALNKTLRRAFAMSIGRAEAMSVIDRVLHLLDPLSALNEFTSGASALRAATPRPDEAQTVPVPSH